jgi:hypothetical protein
VHKLLLKEIYRNINKRFIGINYLDIYTFIDDVTHYEKMLKHKKKKVLRRTYAIGYSNNVISAHSLIDSNSDEYFEEVQQHLKLVIEIKDERPFS